VKIALLTSSRADYSIYFPLIKEISNNKFLKLDIIVFGTHNSYFFGETVKQIEQDGFDIKYKINSLILGESPECISDSMGFTFIKFSNIWSKENYDLCLVLGDRFEMFAAAYSALPFNIPVGHISGGETTLGAIDNTFRDALSVISKYHFASTQIYCNRIKEIKGSNEFIYNVGALNLDNLSSIKFLSLIEFKERFGIDISKKSILITFHPETVSFKQNIQYIQAIYDALIEVDNYQLIITMPNADTMGSIIRDKFNELINYKSNVIIIESFGTVGYLTCMKYCSFMLGNTSSGFVEASFFPKYVINLGKRQSGRILTSNIINCEIDKVSILNAIKEFDYFNPINDEYKIYGNGDSAKKITRILTTL
jgi:GDP/UDP-N,N'-diacetylbacillosamine 2-epimerase (hydrolysing)